MVRLLASVVLVSMLSAGAGFAEVRFQPREAWDPGLPVVEHVESLIVMPAGASPLGAYTRTYQGIVAGDRHHLIGGQFLLTGDRLIHFGRFQVVPPGNRCSAVRADFDVEQDKIISIACVGE